MMDEYNIMINDIYLSFEQNHGYINLKKSILKSTLEQTQGRIPFHLLISSFFRPLGHDKGFCLWHFVPEDHQAPEIQDR